VKTAGDIAETGKKKLEKLQRLASALKKLLKRQTLQRLITIHFLKIVSIL